MVHNIVYVIEEFLYKVVNNKPVVVLYSRNYNDKNDFFIFEWNGCVPYFYCPSDEVDRELPRGCFYDTESIRDAFGRNVTKVFTQIPSDVPKVRELFSFTDMADFLFEKRCAVDHGLTYAFYLNENQPVPIEVDNIVQPRVVFYDIEVLSPEGIFPQPQDTNYPVVSIQVLDSYTNKKLVFTNGIPQLNDSEHIACNNEQDLFKVFLHYIKEINPDVLSGWNSSKFDLPYLIRRSWKIGVNIDGIARYGKVFCEYNPNDGNFNTRVKGRSTLDMLDAFKKYYIMRGQRESYSLKSVSADYGFAYNDHGPFLDKLLNQKQDYETFVQYCKNDVIALQNINEQTHLFDFYENLRKITGTRMDDVLFNSKLIEMYLLHEGIKPMPTKSHKPSFDNKFEGALVLTPPAGVHEWVACVDLASLYPTCMRAFPNETCPDVDLKTIEVLEKVVNKREELREIRKSGNGNSDVETREQVFKTVANSFYGVMGAPTFRLYKRECAEKVTSTGREINTFIHNTLKVLNHSVIYSDTDSSFFSKIKTVEEGFIIQDFLNNKLIEWGEEHGAKVIFSLKFEKLYHRILFKKDKNNVGIKKKYCGFLIWEEGRDCSELNYKGLELKRSDQAELTRECLRYFLEKLLIDGDPDAAVSRVKQAYTDIRDGNINIFDISLPKAVRSVKYANDNAWVRGINTAKELYNYLIQEGAKPRLIYLKNGEICIDEDFDTSLITNLIDYNTMADKVIKNKMESYIWSIGYSWDAIVHGQTNLMNFM